jgi:membrane-bound lytic murein transglycosylase MltF
MSGSVVNINDVLDGHVALTVDCVDRLYLNAYVQSLQVGPQVRRFLEDHLGNQIASPTLLQQIGNRFRRDVKSFAATNKVPMLALKKPDRSRWDDRKLDHVRPYFDRAERAGRFGVVAIVAAQEFQWVYNATRHTGPGGGVYFVFDKSERRVGVYYFYVRDPEFGSGFIKICTYFPYPAKVWMNGHEWAKRQLDRAGIGYGALAQRVRLLRRSSGTAGVL